MAAVIAGSIAASTLASSAISAGAAGSAASQQAAAASSAQATQLAMFNQIQSNLQPYMTGGAGAFEALQRLTGTAPGSAGVPGGPGSSGSPAALLVTPGPTGGNNQVAYGGNLYSVPQSLGAFTPQTPGMPGVSQLGPYTPGAAPGNPLTAPLTAPFQPTMQQLAQTPGYQFTLQQGEQAVQNSYASQGLASSGPALKGAANYAEGLASTTYQQQFQNYLQQNAQISNILMGQAGLGESAAANVGYQGTAAGQGIAQSQMAAGNALAAGTVGQANALSGGIQGLGTAALLYGITGGGQYGGNALGGGASLFGG